MVASSTSVVSAVSVALIASVAPAALAAGKKEQRSLSLAAEAPLSQNGGYLLSHLRSTIGVIGLNCSVRNGKRWNPDAIATLIGLIWTLQHSKQE